MTCNIGKKKFLIRKIFTIALWVFMGVVNAQAQLHMKTTLQNMILWRGIEVADGFCHPIYLFPIHQECLLPVFLAGQTLRGVIRS